MPLTAAQIVTLACQDAKCPGFVAQAGQYLNATLQDLCQDYDLDAALGTFIFTFNSVTGNGSGPYALPADFLRTQVKDGKDEFFYTINGVPYPLIQVTKAEYDWLVQTPGFSSYPYNYATDLSQTPAQLFVWPPASGSYACTMRYYKLMPDIVTPETSATVPWFKNTVILQRGVAGRLMGLTGDSRQAEYLGDDAQRYPLGAGTLLNAYLKNVEDREGAVHTVGRDRRRWGRPFDQLKNTKNIGWAIAAALMFLLAAPDAHAQKTKVQINTEITTQFIDNTSDAITPAILRGITSDIVNSIMPTAPVGSGHAAVFDGTTGLLKDLGSSIVPGAALAGNIAFFTDTTGLTLGAAAIYQTSNPGNAALYSQVAYPTNGFLNVWNVLQVCQGTCIPAGQQFGANNQSVTQAIVGTLAIPVGDTTTFQTAGVAGYAITNMPDRGTSTGPGAVGVFGQGLTGVAGANVFGGSFIAVNTNGDQNSIGKNMNYMAGVEIDVLVWQTSPGVDAVINQGHAYGLTIAGASNMAAYIPKSSAIVIDRISFQTNIPWDYGFSTYAGATNYAVVAGPAQTGANKDSSWIAFQYADAGSSPTFAARLKTDSAGNLIAQSGTSAIISLQDFTGNSLMNMSLSFGASKIRIAACTVAGVMTNDVTTGQVNCGVTTLPSGLTAPALTVTSSFTATGLVTNADLVSPSITINTQTCTLGSSCTIASAATSITVGGTIVNSGTTTRVLFDNAGFVGEYVISGTGNVAMTTSAVFTTPNLGTPSAVTLTNGTGLPTTGLTGTLQAAQEPAHTGDVTNSAGSLALTLVTAQPAVHTWALAQTFTVAPVFTDASGTRTALGLGTAATQNTGTSGATIPFLNGTNTWANTQTFLTSVISPLHYGGSSVNSTVVLSGTSNGSPSNAYVLLQSGTTQFVGINNASPKTTLDVNVNTASSPALILATSVMRVQSADAANGGMEFVSYGGASGNFLTGAVAGGISGTPTATPASRNMFNLSGWGWTGSAWAKGAIIAMGTTSLWSGSNQATELDFYTTPTGSTVLTLAASVLPSGALVVGTLVDPGVGKVHALNGFMANSAAGITKTCTIAVGNVLTFTLGILTATSGVAGCV